MSSIFDLIAAVPEPAAALAPAGGGIFAQIDMARAERARSVFSASPEDLSEAAWQEKLNQLNQRFQGVKIVRNKIGDPSDFTHIVQDPQRGNVRKPLIPADFSPVIEVNNIIKKDKKDRDDLLEEFRAEAEPLDLLRRAGAGAKFTEAGKLDFLKKTIAGADVIPIRGSGGSLENVLILREGQSPLLANNQESNFLVEAFGDVLDFSGAIVRVPAGIFGAIEGAAVGTAVAGPGVGTALGAAGGAALTEEAIGQSISELLPGEDFPTETPGQELAERGAALGTSALFGLAGEAVSPTIKRGAREVFDPLTIARREISKEPSRLRGAARDVARTTEGRLGLGGTPGQLGQGQFARRLEAGGRQRHPDVYDAADLELTRRTADDLGRVLDTVAPSVDPGKIGKLIGAKRLDHLKARFDELGEVATKNFNDPIIKRVGHRRVARMENLRNVIDDELATFGKTAGPNGLRALRSMFAKGGSLPMMQRQLKRWGKALSGSESIFERLDKKENKRIAKRLFGAIQDDLSALIDSGKLGSEGAGLMRSARDVYREMAQGIEDASNEVLDRSIKQMLPKKARKELGSANLIKGGRLVKLLRGTALDESDVAGVLRVVDGIDGATGKSLRRAVVDSILSGAAPAGDTIESAARASFGLPELAKNLFGPRGQINRIKTILGEGSPQFRAIDKIGRFAQAVSVKGATVQGGEKGLTAIFSTILDITRRQLEAPGIGKKIDPRRLQKLILEAANPLSVSVAFNDPIAALQLLRLHTPPPNVGARWVISTLTRFVNTVRRQGSRSEEETTP